MIVLLLATFVVALTVFTFAAAWVADVTGMFRTLYIKRPYRQMFRATRWGAAGAVTLLVADMVS